MSDGAPHPSSLLSNEFDIREILLELYRRWRFIAIATISAASLAAIYAFFVAKPIYQSVALLIPTQPQSVDQLSAATALLGKKPTVNPDVNLYQSLLASKTVVRQMLNAPIANASDTGKGRIEPLFQILKIDTSSRLSIMEQTNRLIKSVEARTKEDNEASGVLEVTFSAGTPWLAQQFGVALLAACQTRLREVRIERSNVILQQLGAAVEQSRDELSTAAQAATVYQGAHRSTLLPEQQLVLYNLNMERQSKEQKYLMARKEYEAQQLEKAKAAPPLMILDPPDLPVKKTKPKRTLIVLIGVIAGLLASSTFVLASMALTPSRRQASVDQGARPG